MVDGKFDLLFGERISKMVQVHELIVDLFPIKIMGAGGTPFHDLLKMMMHNFINVFIFLHFFSIIGFYYFVCVAVVLYQFGAKQINKIAKSQICCRFWDFFKLMSRYRKGCGVRGVYR
jgi:hypothetical protein